MERKGLVRRFFRGADSDTVERRLPQGKRRRRIIVWSIVAGAFWIGLVLFLKTDPSAGKDQSEPLSLPKTIGESTGDVQLVSSVATQQPPASEPISAPAEQAQPPPEELGKLFADIPAAQFVPALESRPISLGPPIEKIVPSKKILNAADRGLFNPILYYIPPLLPGKKPSGPNADCNMHTCFNLTRCLKGVKIYMYNLSLTASCAGFGPITCLYYNGVPEAVRKFGLETTDPNEACLFLRLPPCVHCDGVENYYDPSDPATRIPQYWFEGQNHFFIIQSDWEHPSEIGKSILAKENWPQYEFRRKFDVMFPLPGLLELPDISLVKPITERKFLLTFMGLRYQGATLLRNYLYRIDNDDDVIVRTRCAWFKDERCEIDEAKYNDRGDFKELVVNSKFVINMPGYGKSKFSYRFAEIMGAGAIPVVLVDNFVMPFDSIIEWRWCVVTCKLDDYLELADRLRAISNEELELRVEYCKAIYAKWMYNIEIITQGIIDSIRLNIEEAHAEAQEGRSTRRLLSMSLQ